MTRPYRGLSRRDRELDAQAMAARAAEVGPVLEAAESSSWLIKHLDLAGSSVLAEKRYDSELLARAEFDRQTEHAREHGGHIRLITPQGETLLTVACVGRDE